MALASNLLPGRGEPDHEEDDVARRSYLGIRVGDLKKSLLSVDIGNTSEPVLQSSKTSIETTGRLGYQLNPFTTRRFAF